MALGPIEVVVIAFSEHRFDGSIVPEIRRLVDNGTVRIVDGVFAMKDEDGTSTLVEFGQLDGSLGSGLDTVADRVEGLISDEDVAAFTSALGPGSAAAVIAFEHTWLTPLRDRIVDAGGTLLESIRIPSSVVEEILTTVPDED